MDIDPFFFLRSLHCTGRPAPAHRAPVEAACYGRAASVRAALTLCASLALAACTSLAPPYERPDAPMPAQFATAPASGEPATQVADLDWRDYFTNAELQGLIDKALANNRDLRSAMLRVDEARAAHGISLADRTPTAGLGLDSQRGRVPGDLSPTGRPLVASQHQLGVGFTSWEIDLWGRVRSMNDAALQTYFATVEGRRAATLLLVSQVANSWLSVREYDRRLYLARQALDTRAEARRVFGRRVEVGSASQLEFVQVELLWQQASALVSQLELQRRVQMNALAMLVADPELNLPPSQQPLVDLAALQALAPGLPSQLLENRPDILAAERQLQAANARIGAARAMFFPRIALTSMVGTASAELGGLFSSGSRAWSFAPSVSLPLFDGGRRQANLELTKVQREQAVNHYQQTIQSAFRDVADGLAARQWLDQQLQTLRATEQTLTRRSQLVNRRYQAGAARYFEVLDAERDLLAAQQQVVQAEHALMSAQVGLYAALGGGSRALDPAASPQADAATRP